MKQLRICPIGNNAAIKYASNELANKGVLIESIPKDATHILLPIPSLDSDGRIKGGPYVDQLLTSVQKGTVLIGGSLNGELFKNISSIDLLKDPIYLAKNASITAQCALRYAFTASPAVPEQCSFLVIGWGRIGKCLAALLKAIGAKVTVAARKEEDRAILSALGYEAVGFDPENTVPCRVVYNTVPVPIEPFWPYTAIKIDLASSKGIPGDDVIWAKGLPGKDAPESSGKLIAETVLRLI